MSTSKKYMKQLKSRDPAERKAAIKGLAKLKDRGALEKLARMAGDDKDKEVRELARKAGGYILHETGGINPGGDTAAKASSSDGGPPPPLEVSAKGKVHKVPVDDDDQATALELLDEAMSYQMNNNKVKMMSTLAKALNLDPNLRVESYFTSLVEQATGIDGEEGIMRLYNKKLRSDAAQKQAQEEHDKRLEEHQAETGKTTWNDVFFDLMLFAVIASVTAIVAGFVLVQSASGYVNSYETNYDNVGQAILLGQIVENPNDSNDFRYWVDLDESGDPILFAEIVPDAAFLSNARDIAEIEVPMIMLAALAFGVGGALMLALMNEITHLVSSSVLQGVGTSTYLIHTVVGLWINRVVLIGVLVGIGSVLVFSSGGGMIMNIMGGIVALFMALIVFKVISTVGKAYDFGFMKGAIATSAGSAVVAVIVGLGFIFLA